MMDCFATFAPNGTVTFVGIDHENSKPMTVVHHQRDIVVIKHPGGKGWSGNYQPRTSIPARFMVFRITGPVRRDGSIRLDAVCDVPLRAPTLPLDGRRPLHFEGTLTSLQATIRTFKKRNTRASRSV